MLLLDRQALGPSSLPPGQYRGPWAEVILVQISGKRMMMRLDGWRLRNTHLTLY